MTNDVSIFDNSKHVFAWLAIDHNLAALNSASVVFSRAVTKLGRKDVQDLAPSPALLAESVVCEVVGRDTAKTVREVVRARPGVTGRYCNSWREWRRRVGASEREWMRLVGGGCHSHARGWVTANPGQVGKDSW